MATSKASAKFSGRTKTRSGSPSTEPKPKRKQPAKARTTRTITKTAQASKANALKLSLELQAQLVGYIALGNYRKDAAAYVGISEYTLASWTHKARLARERIATEEAAGRFVDPTPEEQPFVDLLDAVERAESQAIVNAVRVVRTSMDSQNDIVALRAATWFLERKAPDRFGRNDRLTVGGDATSPIRIEVTMDEQEARTEFIIGELVRHGVVGELPDEIEDAELVT